MSGFASTIPQREGAGRFKNWLIGKRGIPHSFHKLGGEKGDTIFRAIPEFVNGKEMPLRLKAGDNEFSYFMRIEQGVSYAGLGDKFACLTRVKDPEPTDGETGPIEKFFRQMKKALKDTPQLFAQAGFADWLAWIGNRGALSRLEDYGFLQGALFKNGKMTYLAEDKKTYKPLCPVVMQTTGTGWGNLLTLCNTEVKDAAGNAYNGNPEDFNARYACGDLLSCAGGRLVTFTYHAAGAGGFANYAISLGQPVPLDPRVVASWWRPWEEVLNFLTAKEQFYLLLSHFPAEALDYVFAGTTYHRFMPEEKKGSWQRAMQPRQFGYGPPPPGYAPQGYAPAPGQTQFVPAPQLPQEYMQQSPQQYQPSPGQLPMMQPAAGQPFGPPATMPMAPQMPAPMAPQMPAQFAAPPANYAPAPALPPQQQYAPQPPQAPQAQQPSFAGSVPGQAPAAPSMLVDLTGGPGANSGYDDSQAPWVTGGGTGPAPSVQMGGNQPAFPPYPGAPAPQAPTPQAPQAQQPGYQQPQAPQAQQPAYQPQQYAPPGVPPLQPPTGAPMTAAGSLEEARNRLAGMVPPQALPGQPH